MNAESRIFGPPGCGKTTTLAGSIRSTIRERTSRIMVASFTRAAAHEIAGRDTGLDASSVGTLHSFAYRSIDRPPLAEERIEDWNKAHPVYALSTAAKTSVDEMAPTDFSGATEGDKILGEVEVLRAQRTPEVLWPIRAQAFYRHWQQWKTDEGVIDFTDMIEGALSVETAPGDPVVGIFDETQDFTPLELALVRHWGKGMETLVLAGDDDQVLYGFKGATPDAFLDPPLPPDRVRVLDQSYRVPRAVHAAAEHWITAVSRRQPKVYLPRDADGLARYGEEFLWPRPDAMVRDLQGQLDAGRSVMVLASCAYMLDPLKKSLKENGLPFHNPYRASRNDWNPLVASGKSVSTAQRVLAYLILDERIFGDMARAWTGGDVKRWSHLIQKKGVFRRGAAAAIAGLPDRELSYAEVASLFETPEAAEAAVEPSLQWFKDNLLGSIRARAEYPIKIAETRGPKALYETPKLVIGSIHSVKGAQADTVYLFPDLPPSGNRDWLSGQTGVDAIVRQFYVGMTRAAEELVICRPATPVSLKPESLLRTF